MSPDLPDATEPEELASAILDGEATDAERARAGDPEVAAALEAFGRVSAAVGAEPPVDELARERAIAAALGAWGTPTAEEEAIAAEQRERFAAVDELARRRRNRLGLKVAGIAAAVAAVVAVGSLAVGSGDDEDSATSADVAAEAPESGVATESAGAGATADADAAEESEAAADGATSSLALSDLGAYDDLDTLVADAVVVATERAAEANDDGADSAPQGEGDAGGEVAEGGAAPTVAAGAGGATACALPSPPAGEPATASTATLEGRPVLVTVSGSGDDAVVQVTDPATCEVLYEGPATG